MRNPGRFALLSIAIIVAAHLGDRWAWNHFTRPDVYEHDWGRMLREVGFLPSWLLASCALWLHTRDRSRALLVALTPTAGGALCALLQVLIRRERPGLHEGRYVFRAFTDRPWHGAEFGLPSSHALVAFSGAWMLCRLYPRARLVWLVLAIGCALTRVLAQAHFLSDVVVAAVAGYWIVALIWSKFPARGAITSSAIPLAAH